MKHDEQVCNTTLDLGIGLSQFAPKRDIRDDQKNKQMFLLDLSIPLRSSDHSNIDFDRKIEDYNKASKGCSFSNASKEDEDRNYEQSYIRKKLRLSNEQVILLEDTFKQHTTLNTVQKQTLAGKLNLKPRQVEVWFQNRRARTKLKQTEMDCEFLKKNCERLSEENRRLNRELAELQSAVRMEPPPPTAAIAQPFFIQIPKAGLAMCPSCEKSRGGDGGRSGLEVVLKPKQK